MTSIVQPRRTAATGRPLGLLDVVAKIARTLWVRRRPTAADQARADAAAVRRYADSQRAWSPSFAADLHAAVDRHEQLDGR